MPSRSRPSSRLSVDYRPQGPRSPSRSPRPPTVALPSTEDDLAQQATAGDAAGPSATPRRPTYSDHSAASIPRSKRQPFDQPSATEATSRTSSMQDDSSSIRSVEPLVIRRKPSAQLHTRRKQHPVGQRTPSMTKASARAATLRRVSSSIKHTTPVKPSAAPVSVTSDIEEETKRLLELSQDTADQVCFSSWTELMLVHMSEY